MSNESLTVIREVIDVVRETIFTSIPEPASREKATVLTSIGLELTACDPLSVFYDALDVTNRIPVTWNGITIPSIREDTIHDVIRAMAKKNLLLESFSIIDQMHPSPKKLLALMICTNQQFDNGEIIQGVQSLESVINNVDRYRGSIKYYSLLHEIVICMTKVDNQKALAISESIEDPAYRAKSLASIALSVNANSKSWAESLIDLALFFTNEIDQPRWRYDRVVDTLIYIANCLYTIDINKAKEITQRVISIASNLPDDDCLASMSLRVIVEWLVNIDFELAKMVVSKINDKDYQEIALMYVILTEAKTDYIKALEMIDRFSEDIRSKAYPVILGYLIEKDTNKFISEFPGLRKYSQKSIYKGIVPLTKSICSSNLMGSDDDLMELRRITLNAPEIVV